ncbi:hypothetical protein [Pseudophaeobacter sp.]|uniref:hypothetical protein n=1 Tax=Pseudophaeobacter sp. TaxID=1971739 RepID=UPI003298E424
MIIYLNVTTSDLKDIPEKEAEQLLTNLIDADRCGRHLVIIGRSVCRWALENLHLSGSNSGHLVGIMEDFTIRGDSYLSGNCFLNVVLGVQKICVVENYFTIGHLEFSQGGYSSLTTQIVVENITSDKGVYEFILNSTIAYTNVPRWNADFVQGGGSTTADVFDSEIEKKRITVCLYDTDKISPCDRFGATAKKIRNFHNKRNSSVDDPMLPYIGTAKCTIGHEVENYIPLSAVSKLKQFDLPEGLAGIVSQSSSADAQDCFWMFFDFKKGVSGSKIRFKIDEGHKSQNVEEWISKKTKCSQEDFCSLDISGIGKNVPSAFLKSDEAKSAYLEFCTTDYWKDLFLSYFEDILWYLAAPVASRL